MEKAVLKNFPKLTGKFQACNFIKNRIQHRCFSVHIAKSILKIICSVSSCFCIDSFIKFKQFLNRLRTIKLLTIQSKFIN